MSIPKNTWPIEASLQNLLGCPVGTIVASCWATMTMKQDLFPFFMRNTTLDDLVNTNSEEKRIIPKVMPQLREELLLLVTIQILRQHLPHQIICYVSKLGDIVIFHHTNCKQALLWEFVIDILLM
mgnify:CR=1 FL=1